jgi:hypothetical protein
MLEKKACSQGLWIARIFADLCLEISGLYWWQGFGWLQEIPENPFRVRSRRQ